MDLEISKFGILILFLGHLSTEPPQGIDRSLFCESCLALTKEMKSILTKISGESREEVVKSLTKRVLCDTASFQSPAHTEEQMREACKHLLDVYGEDFGSVLREKDEDLDILLCYERSLVCVGIKQLKSQTHHLGSVDNDIQALIEKNKVNVRTARPIHANPVQPSKDEL